MPKKNAASLVTESVNERFRGSDQWETIQYIDALIDTQIASLEAMKPLRVNLANAVDDAANTLEATDTGRLIAGGAGTPARITRQDLLELWPTFGFPKTRIDFANAGGVRVMQYAVENAEDNTGSAIRRIAKLKLTPHDVFIAISANGNTPYTVAAARAAKDAGAITVGIASNENSKLLQVVKHPIFVQTGAEPVAGSTRMNAGTAQMSLAKIFSTAVMRKMGRTYNGHMVCVIPTNEKLRQRVHNTVCQIVYELTGRDEPRKAAKALARAKEIYQGYTDKNTKLAVLLTLGITEKDSIEYLEQNRYHLHPVIESLKL